MVGGVGAWWEELVHGGRSLCIVGGVGTWWEELVHGGRN